MSRLGKHQLHELYYHLKLARRLEDEIERLDREGRIPGSYALASGVEAVGVGSAYLLDTEDVIASALPSVAPLLVKGVRPRDLLSHLMGRQGMTGGGRDGWLHFGHRASGVFPRTGHLGAHISVMAGVAFAAKYEKSSRVALALVTEHALATGDFHEGVNFAIVHKVPLIIVVQTFPASVGAARLLGGHDVYERVRGYGLASLPVDGSDILQVLQVVDTAINRARKGNGPTVIEARARRTPRVTARESSSPAPFTGGDATSSVSDPHAREFNDPLGHFETFLSDHGLLHPDENVSLRETIERLVEEELHAAEAMPRPDPRTLTQDVCREASRTAEPASR